MIQFLKHSQIDKKQWDACISSSVNGLVYAYSWWLDEVSPGWEALVSGSYQTVMPLPVKRKYFIRYLVQPKFTQQLGIFSTHVLTEKTISEFLDQIPKKFIRTDFQLNTLNSVQQPGISTRVTHHLLLAKPYTETRKLYSENHTRSLKKAEKNKLLISSGLSPEEFIRLFKNTIGLVDKNLKPEDYILLQKLISISLHKGCGTLLGAYDSMNQLVGAAFFVRSDTTAIYIAGCSDQTGKDTRAMHALMDSYIRQLSGENFTLDFEGSEIESIAGFFKGFGAIPVNYFRYRKSIV